ncbi:gliding motility-associated C-terminal domain-containing protein, partial [Flavobacterium sp. FlaQc-48]|uniref:DUF7507 domain-containing protein n=1 Tax=Flavobacterium sp. FlaQc-48 TaxID=3374181 RepID=UPI003756EAFF
AVYNLATATGTPPSGPNVSDTSTDPLPCTTCAPDPGCPTCTITPLAPASGISITKHGVFVDADKDGKTNVGDRVEYTFVVKNTGNTTLSNITVTDNNAIVTGGPIAQLLPGLEDATTFKAVHTITQADIDAGMVYNLATVTSKDPKGDDTTGTSTDPLPCTTCTPDPKCPDCTITPLAPASGISITKHGQFVDVNKDGKTNVGDRVEYTFVVTNTGNTTLSNITVTDNNAVVTGGPLLTLAVGAEDATTFKAVHAITQADIDAGIVYNLATVTSKDPKGEDTTGTSTDPLPCTTCTPDPKCPDCTITPLAPASGISITKHGVFVDADKDGKTNVGDRVEYTFVVKNTGNTTLTNITVSDDNATVKGGPILVLLPGAEDATIFTGIHIVTQADIDAGMVYNLATVIGKDPNGIDIQGTSTDPLPCTTCRIEPDCSDCTITPLPSESSIAVIKRAVFVDENHDGYAQAGETIRYSFEIKNTGETSLTNVIVTDNLPGLVLSGNPISLAVGEINTTNFIGIYSITQADIDFGSVTNQALAEGTTPSAEKVNDLSDYENFTGDNPTVIDVIKQDCAIEVFNAVSPNGDGINDEFHIKGLECYPTNTVEIYNRWGVKVFETSGYNSNGNVFKGYSDGRTTISRGAGLPDGTYFYILKYLDNTSHKMLDKSGYLYIKN